MKDATLLSIMLATVLKRIFLCVALVSLALGTVACGEDEGLKIKSISPNSGPADGAGNVTIHGSGFTKGGAMGVKIYFGDKKARFLRFEGDTKMIVVPPSGKVGEKVDLLVIFGDSRQHTFPGAYSYINPKAGFGIDALTTGKANE